MRQFKLQTSWGELTVAAGSRAGEASVVLLPQIRLAFDAGRPLRALVPMHHVVISHGHADHLAGLLAWAAQRQLNGIPAGTVYAPASIASDLAELLAIAARLEGGAPYDVAVRPVGDGDTETIHPDFRLRFFSTSHWVDTVGSVLEWRRDRILDHLAGLPGEEIRRRRERGESITHEVVTPLVAYAADSGPEVWERHPWLADIEVLVLECTFIAPEERDRARRFGHTHLEDIVAAAPRLHNRHVILTHLSRRHRLGPGERTIRAALDGRLSGELHLANVDWP